MSRIKNKCDLLVISVLQVYEYGTVIKDAVDIHYPVIEMVCNSKIRFVHRLYLTLNSYS